MLQIEDMMIMLPTTRITMEMWETFGQIPCKIWIRIPKVQTKEGARLPDPHLQQGHKTNGEEDQSLDHVVVIVMELHPDQGKQTSSI
jgi:hypothetical protein